MRKWLITLRESQGYTQADVSRAVGVKQPTYFGYEHGNYNPSPKVAQRIGKLLGFDWKLFFPDEEEKRA